MTKRAYRLTAVDLDSPHVDILGEFDTYEAALDQLAVHRRSRLWREFRIDEYDRGSFREREKAIASIRRVAEPRQHPLYGSLHELW
jgi:hypothetical protein